MLATKSRDEFFYQVYIYIYYKWPVLKLMVEVKNYLVQLVSVDEDAMAVTPDCYCCCYSSFPLLSCARVLINWCVCGYVCWAMYAHDDCAREKTVIRETRRESIVCYITQHDFKFYVHLVDFMFKVC